MEKSPDLIDQHQVGRRALSGTACGYPCGMRAHQTGVARAVGGALASTLVLASILLIPSPAAAVCLVGSGTAGNPYQVASPADLECLRTTSGYWASGTVLRQTADIDMTSEPAWTAGIAAGASFDGTYDGGGHVIRGLRVFVTGTAPQAAPFATTGSSATIQDLGIIDVDVRAVDTSASGYPNVYAGGMVGYLDLSRLERVYTTGTVAAQSPWDPSIVYAGGIVADQSAGVIIDSYSRAQVAAESGSASRGSGESAVAGGVAGASTSSPLYSTPLTRSYAAGRVTATTSGADRWQGGVAGRIQPLSGETSVEVTGLLWDTSTTGQTACLLGVGATGTCTGHGTSAMQSIDTYLNAGWSISYGLTGSSTWGICPAINSGYPFLRVFAPTGLCETSGQYPPPWYQSYARGAANDVCESGWLPSWDSWPHGHTGGWVCNRKLFYNGSEWVFGPSA